MTRGRFVSVWLALAIVSSRCAQQPSVITVALVDGSASRVGVDEYVRGWQRIVASTRPGDRLVLGLIRSDTVGFRPEFDETLPRKLLLLDNVFDREKRRAGFVERAQRAMASALEQEALARTPILDTLSAIAPVFVSATQPSKRLVIFSDMLEDSGVARFVQADHVETARIIADLRRDHGLPNLAGVEVFVVGASAPSNHLLRVVEDFWRPYFHATGAHLTDGHYASVLLDWPGER